MCGWITISEQWRNSKQNNVQELEIRNWPCVQDTLNQTSPQSYLPDQWKIWGRGWGENTLDDGVTTAATNTAALELPSPQAVKVARGFEVQLTLASVQTHDTSFGRSAELDQSLSK